MRPAVPALLLLAGCGTFSNQSVADHTMAPPAVRAVRFRLEDRVAVVTEGSVGAAFDERLLAAVRSELMGRGLNLGGGSFDLLLHLGTQVSGVGYAISGEASLEIEREGRVVDRITTEKMLHPGDEFLTEAARLLATRLLQSPSVAEMARLRAPAPPAPPPNPAARARAHAQQGTAHYNLDQWPEALTEYEAAYLVFPDPALLFNIAQCHRKLGHRALALDYFRKYQRAAPAAPNHAEVEKRIEELEEKPQPKPVRRKRR